MLDRMASTSRRKFATSIASVGRLVAGHSDGCFQHLESVGAMIWRQRVVIALLCGVMGGITGCASHDDHQESRDSRQDAQKSAQSAANDPHIPPQVKQMLQERGKAMQIQRPASK